MESLCQRFPNVIELVLDNLDDKSLVNCREASRKMSELLPKGRFYWIRRIKKYNTSFRSFKTSWRQVINKTSVEIIKELAVEVQNFFINHAKYWVYFDTTAKNIAPLHIAAEQGNFKLCEHILKKTEDKNPLGDMHIVYETTPLQLSASKGYFEICSLIMDYIDVNEDVRYSNLKVIKRLQS